jgi:sulfur carrier protein
MSNRNHFKVNGYLYSTETNLTIFDLLRYFNHKPSLLVIEYNHKICEKRKWDKIFLKNNDTIELITIVGGG